MDFIDKNNSEIEFFNNDIAQVTHQPVEGKFIFKHEQYAGAFWPVDKFFIVHIDNNGKEIERWNALSDCVTFIRWAE